MATFKDVRAFLCETCRVSRESLTPSTRLLHDLGIDGDDAVEILTDFGKRFGVDLSSFPFQRYFGSEVGAGIRWLVRKVHGRDAIRLASITLQDLLDAANQGRWLDSDRHKV